jgi:type II secretory pathway component PulJ
MRVVNQWGYGLLELLIGLSVSLMVMLAALSMMTSASVTQTRLDAKTNLSLELSRLLTMMESDIRRAGLCYQCGETAAFQVDQHLILIESTDGTDDTDGTDGIDDTDNITQGQCIRFAYQQTGVTPQLDAGKDDVKGFRFDADNQAVEIYENHDDTSNWTCQSGYWRDISSRNIVIDNLTFERKEVSTSNHRTVTALTITLSAALKEAPHTQESLSRTLVLRNTMRQL